MTIDPYNDPHARIVIKKLPSKKDDQASPSKLSMPAVQSAFIRAENEDDDGYDPYSDRPAEAEPTFQEDPWR